SAFRQRKPSKTAIGCATAEMRTAQAAQAPEQRAPGTACLQWCDLSEGLSGIQAAPCCFRTRSLPPSRRDRPVTTIAGLLPTGAMGAKIAPLVERKVLLHQRVRGGRRCTTLRQWPTVWPIDLLAEQEALALGAAGGEPHRRRAPPLGAHNRGGVGARML